MAINGNFYESTNAGSFNVVVKSREVIRAELALPVFRLPLSNLDLLLPPLDASIYFIYTTTDDASYDLITSILKKSLARVLVHYYPLAGEMVVNPLGEPELLCNNNGVEFIEATTDIELNEMKLYDPDETVKGKLAPQKTMGVLCAQDDDFAGKDNSLVEKGVLVTVCLKQATKLRCGGMVVACTMDHRAVDGYSTNMFVSAWAEMARTGALTVAPNFKRSLLRPRRPGSYNKYLKNMYIPVPSPTALKVKANKTPSCIELVSRIYHMSATNMDRLQALACNNGTRRTKLEAIGACLWKSMADSSEEDAERCRLGVVVDGRSRLSDCEWGPSAEFYNYFGNVISIPFGEESVADLRNRSLSWAAKKVHEVLAIATNKEHFRDIIDYTERRRPEAMMTRLYYRGENQGVAVVISHGRVFDAKGVDFGWGSPLLASCHFPWGGDARYVMLMPSPLGNGDWVVYMHLFKHQLHGIEKMQGGIFQPITVQHLTTLNQEFI